MADEIDSNLVEKMQMEYESNPNSKVFAPLADAYRKMGLLDEALRVAQLGVLAHPNFPSGRIILGRVQLEKGQPSDALIHLQRAADLAPDNRMAQMLLGETLLLLRRPKDALRAFKMVLLNYPTDARALEIISKWEFLTAEDYSEDAFQVLIRNQTSTKSAAKSEGRHSPEKTQLLESRAQRDLERAVSLADALTVRNDAEKAIEVLKNAVVSLGEQPELVRRINILTQRQAALEPREEKPIVEKRARLEKVLRRIIEYRKLIDPSRSNPR